MVKPREPKATFHAEPIDGDRIMVTVSIPLPEFDPVQIRDQIDVRGVGVLRTADGDLVVLGDWRRR